MFKLSIILEVGLAKHINRYQADENAHEKSLFLLYINKKQITVNVIYKVICSLVISEYELSDGALAGYCNCWSTRLNNSIF